MVCWCDRSHYEVVKETFKYGFNYHLTKRGRSDWDVAWWDGPTPLKLLSKM